MNRWAVKTRKKLNRVSVLWSARLVLMLSKLLPYRLGVRAGGCLGWVGYYLIHRERTRALIHLRSAFPDKSEAWIRRTARRCFMHLGKSVLEMTLMSPVRLAKASTLEGAENLERAFSRGKGVIYFTGHVGNWELSGGVLASRYPLSVVAAPLDPEPLNDLILKLRSRIGIRVILRGRPGASRELIRVFRENRILGLLIDQDTDVDGTFVDFMGRPAWTPTAAASMAIKFDAPVVFGYAQRGKDNNHTITIEGPLELVRTGNDEQDIITNTALFTKKIENSIMRNPEQWVWMHRRWRRMP